MVTSTMNYALYFFLSKEGACDTRPVWWLLEQILDRTQAEDIMKKYHPAEVIIYPVSTCNSPKAIYQLELKRKYFCSVGSSDILKCICTVK